MIDSLLLDTLLVLGTLALIIAFVLYQVYQFRSLASHGIQISAMVTSIRHETGKTAWGFTRDNYWTAALSNFSPEASVWQNSRTSVGPITEHFL